MCGIAGFIGDGSREVLVQMTETLAHRGPDGTGTWVDEGQRIYLGHRRLAVIDLACGAQPMKSADGARVIVFNGEIYNHRELRKELEALGQVFRSDHSDTEVLLAAHAQWGEAMLQRLNGMWSFALLDRVRRTLFCSRDRFGKKPFYFAAQRGSFVFGSELRALERHPALRGSSVSTVSLHKYFAYGYIPAPRTILDGVSKLPAGHSLTVALDRPDAPVVSRYWRYEVDSASPGRGAAPREWTEELLRLFGRAVARRLDADVPVGVFLSGGIDSSAVAAMACRSAGALRIKTFSVGFTEPSFDESQYARQVATHLGTEHHVQTLSMERAVEELPGLAASLDEPMADSSLLPCHLLSRFARQHVTVALGGDGGDELFAGYDPFLALERARRYQALVPRPLHRGIQAVVARLPVSHRNMSLDFKLKRTLRGLDHRPAMWLPTWMAPLGIESLNDLFGERLDPEELFSEAVEAWESCTSENLVDRTSQFYIELYLQNDILPKVDQASMMHGLEVRCPFLDIEFVDFVRRIPASFKLRNGRTKALLKEALAGVLPHDILHRKKKGFGVPIGAWFKEGAITAFGDSGPNARFTAEALARHRAGRQDERAYLWAQWVFERWIQKR